MKKGVWVLNRLLSMQMFLSHFFLELRSHFENAGLSLVWNKNVSLIESSQKSLEQILASEVGKWKLFVFHNLSCFLRKNQIFIEVQLESTSSNMPDLLYMNSAWHIFKTHACDFESYLEFLGNLENKICTLVETRYFYYSNDLKNDKECWKSWARPFNFYQVLFIYKKWDTFDDISLTENLSKVWFVLTKDFVSL